MKYRPITYHWTMDIFNYVVTVNYFAQYDVNKLLKLHQFDQTATLLRFIVMKMYIPTKIPI